MSVRANITQGHNCDRMRFCTSGLLAAPPLGAAREVDCCRAHHAPASHTVLDRPAGVAQGLLTPCALTDLLTPGAFVEDVVSFVRYKLPLAHVQVLSQPLLGARPPMVFTRWI